MFNERVILRDAMKNTIFLMVLIFGFVGTSNAEKYVEGKDYLSVSQPTRSGDKIEVLEFFWYGCPHCYHFEPHIKKWLKTKKDNIEFVKIPAVFHKSWKVHARTFYALKEMGIEEIMSPKIFSMIHEKRKRIDTLKTITAYLEKQKVNKEKFLEAYNSFSVETSLRKAIKRLSDYDVKGVPAVVVNGKYYLTGTISGTYEKLIETVDYLIKKEEAAMKK